MLLVHAAVHVVPPLLHQARQVHQRRHQPCCNTTYLQVQLLLNCADAQATQVSRDETSGVMAGLPASVIVPFVSHDGLAAPLAQ